MSNSSLFQDAFATSGEGGIQCDVEKQHFAVADLHWFKGENNEFIVKEFALVNQNDNYALIHFKSPYAKSSLCEKLYREASYLERHYHKISWCSGETDFSDSLIVDYLKTYNHIYTKGREKADFLRKYHGDVREIPENFPKPDFTKPTWCTDSCSIHRKLQNARCALVSAYHYLLLLTSNHDTILKGEEVDYMCENNRMESMRGCNFYGKKCKRNFARQGFFYDGKSIVCVYCGYDLECHRVRICCLNNGGGKPINFSVLIPLYK